MKKAETRWGDCLTPDRAAVFRWSGHYAGATEFIMEHQLLKPELWKSFVELFREKPDAPWGWRGEFWGKMMRGASGIYRFNRNRELYAVMRESVCDLLDCAEPCGRISTYARETEFIGWDLWCRKYVLLGLQYFSEICEEPELKEQVKKAMCRHLDYIVGHVGDGEGKILLSRTTNVWNGLNSCSVLEPVVRLWQMTGEPKYLEFADYLVGACGCEDGGENLFELAYRDEMPPFRYPVVKAYELMSCFEGLAEYYRATGVEKWKTAVVNFGRRMRETEVTVIGGCGCLNELLNHSALTQTKSDYREIMQETCVTVTWMKLCQQLLRITGDPAYADCIEQTFENAYLGTLNTHEIPSTRSFFLAHTGEIKDSTEEKVTGVLPFDSYSPLIGDRRGKAVGGFNVIPGRSFYGCCACMGSAGAGMIPQYAVMRSENGIVLNYYQRGEIRTSTPGGQEITFRTETDYPYDGRIGIRVALKRPERFSLCLRVPEWSRETHLIRNGEEIPGVDPGYADLLREWRDGDTVELILDFRVTRQAPPAGACEEERYYSYHRGPLVLAADSRLGEDPLVPVPVVCDGENCVAGASVAECPEIPDAKLCVRLPLREGGTVRLIDYASAGKTWSEASTLSAWLEK